METKVELKDGTAVVIRPLTLDDVDRSVTFFTALPEEDRAYLRGDVTQAHLVAERIRDTDTGRVKRLAALVDDKIVADGALELGIEPWKKHVAELRLIVARDFQRKGLGMLMARELYTLASACNVEEVVVRMMRPQLAAHSIFRKLGFREEVLLPDYVKDVKGRKQDMILMRCDLAALWKEMEELVTNSDWRRAR